MKLIYSFSHYIPYQSLVVNLRSLAIQLVTNYQKTKTKLKTLNEALRNADEVSRLSTRKEALFETYKW